MSTITTPRPIPISKRMPKPYDPGITEPQDCDPMGRCWVGCPSTWDEDTCEEIIFNASWELACPVQGDFCWLPHWALPLPEVES
jgi:hypothetical protein